MTRSVSQHLAVSDRRRPDRVTRSSSSPLSGTLRNGSGADWDRTRSWLASLGVERGRILRAEEFVARSLAVMLHFEDGSALFLKEVDHAAGTAINAAHRNEEKMLRFAPAFGFPQATLRAIPELVTTDPDNGIIVMEGKAGLVSLRTVAAQTPVIPVVTLAALASVIAGVHRTPVAEAIESDVSGLRSYPFPFASFAVLTPEQLVSGPGVDYPAYVAAMQDVDEAVDELRRAWSPDALVHFDLRDDNILLGDDPNRPEVALVDWEMAGFGDPMLDVGTVLGQLLVQWLQTVRTNPRQLATPAAWTTVRRNASLFLSAYEYSAPLTGKQRTAVFRYAGLFVLMHAAGLLEQVGSLGRMGHLCLFVGRRLLNNPQSVAPLFLTTYGRSEAS